MSRPTSMIIRVQSREGTKRVEIAPRDRPKHLYEKVRNDLKLEKNGWALFKSRDGSDLIREKDSKSVKDVGLRHGDMVFIKEDVPSAPQKASDDWLFEEEIDVTLSNEDGLTNRKRDPQLCHHGPHGKCLHCSPLEPYDEEYLKTLNPPVKHMAFHAFIKKLRSGASRGKFASLEDISCKIKPGCTEHPPWPKGICTKCQPSAITLQRQPYRHVDNIMFENSVIVDRFLNYWRKTGTQRFGFLYGYYEKHENVPLGIRATVAAIYEPPQESTRDSIEFKDDPNAELVDRVAADVGLRKVGCILTDLIADDTKKGTVQFLRHIETHFLSAQETILAADFQNQNPNICKLSSSARFGSKFVTVVVSGNEENHIHFDGWQVSNQCMALVRDNCLAPTVDDPSLGYVKESSSEQYVPDVFYKEIDTYKNEVTKIARPMPIEFFLIGVPAAFPLQPSFTFPESRQPFFIENRQILGEKQDFNALMKYLEKIPSAKLMDGLFDFHLLIFLMTSDLLPLKSCMADLCKALKNKDEEAFHHWTKSEEWSTVLQIIAAHANLEELQNEERRQEEEIKAQKEEMKQRCLERQGKVENASDEYMQFKYDIAKSAESSRSGKPIQPKDLEQFQSQEQKKEEDVRQVRLENIKLKNKLRKKEQQLKAKEELAEGLHLIDFEQLKIENQTYNEKIEERNEEILKLRKKITTTVQVLTHLKEKLQFVQGENGEQRTTLKTIEATVAQKRDLLTRTKQVRDALRMENLKLKQKCGLLGNESLLRDFEERVDEEEDLAEKLQELKTDHAGLSMNLNGVKKKIRESRNMSSS